MYIALGQDYAGAVLWTVLKAVLIGGGIGFLIGGMIGGAVGGGWGFGVGAIVGVLSGAAIMGMLSRVVARSAPIGGRSQTVYSDPERDRDPEP